MIIAVIGATGFAGKHIVGEALRRGHQVIAASRTAAPLRDGLTPRSGSVFDPDFVAGLAAEAEVLVVAVRAQPGPEGALVDTVPALLAAVSAHGARLGVVGGAGSLRTPGGSLLLDRLPDDIKAEPAGAKAVLDALKASGSQADWFFVSPAATFGAHVPAGERTGRYRVGGDELLVDVEGVSAISGPDYAVAFLDEIDRPRHHRERFCVAY